MYFTGRCDNGDNGSDASPVYPTEAEKEELIGIGRFKSIAPVSLAVALKEKYKRPYSYNFSDLDGTKSALARRKFSTKKMYDYWSLMMNFLQKSCYFVGLSYSIYDLMLISFGREMCKLEWYRLSNGAQ